MHYMLTFCMQTHVKVIQGQSIAFLPTVGVEIRR